MKTIKRIVAFFLILIFAVFEPAASFQVSAASKVPGIDAAISMKNVEDILKKYDPDGAYIMQKQKAVGDDILVWFNSGGRIVDSIDVAVHEETHGYSFHYAKDYYGMAYFVGKKKTVQVSYTKVYESKKMARSIPKRLRTFRYNTYVGRPTANLASNVRGAYGLLNEFMAYRAGMNTTISLFSYYKSKKADWNAWQGFISSCENNRLAYAEFKYYILHYLYYAKKYYPDIYKGIMGNGQFCRAYKKIESSYAKLIKTYAKDLKKLKSLLEAKGYHVEANDEHFILYNNSGSGSGLRRFTEDYKKLQKEINKKKYRSIHSRLVRNGK